MRLKEQKLWDTMRRNAPKHLVMERMENAVGSGMPDVFVFWPLGKQVWVELKAPKRPKRQSTPLMGEKEGLRQSQKNWIKRHANMGFDAWILIRDDSGELFLIHGEHADEVNDYTIHDLTDHTEAKTWVEVFQTITHGYE